MYDITRIDTTSPTGAPADRTLEVVTSGRVSGYAVRIGDPDQTVRGRAQTYRVSYQIAGALRTFDGVPELHWDVTSEDMPTIQRFTTTVRAPQGITRAHCYVGDRDCATALADGVATLSGSEAAVGDTITVAAALPAGSVAGAEPRLESPLSVESEVSAIDATATVHPDGSMTVEQTMDWVFPRGRASLWFTLPERQPWSTGEDLVRSYSGVQLLLDGRPLEVEPFGYTSGRSNESVRLAPAAELPENLERATVVLRYTVTGAVLPEGGRFGLDWPLGEHFTDATRGTVAFILPETPVSADCLRYSSLCTTITTDIAGRTVTNTLDGSPSDAPTARIVWPEGTFAGLALPLEPSQDAARQHDNERDFWAGIGGLVAVGGVGFLLGRRRREPAQRFANTPPGIVDHAAAVVVDRGVDAPVRFSPPALALYEAGALLDGTYRPNHLVATLVQMAVDQQLRLATEPLSLRAGSSRPDIARPARSELAPAPFSFGTGRIGTLSAAALDDELEQAVRRAIARPQPLNRRDREQLVDVFAAATDATLGRYAAADAGSRRGGAVRRWWPLAVAAVAVLAAGTYLTRSLNAGGVLVCFLLVALFAGAAHGAFVTRQRVLAGRSAVGTAARDQVLGFRRFLATAEADQLDFEAGEDIYRRHLPWAALFGLTERWTRVGQELAAAGLIEAIDLSDLGLTSAADADAAVRLGAGLARAARVVRPVPAPIRLPGQVLRGRAHEPPGRRLVGRGLVGQSWRLVLGGGQFGQFVGVAWRRRGGSGGGGTSGHSW